MKNCFRQGLRSLAFVSAFAALPVPAWAIPAPDLIVSSVSSLSQMLAMLSVVLGGGALFGTKVRNRRSSSGQGGLGRALFAGAFVIMTVSIGVNFWQWQTHQAEKDARLQATLNRPAVERGKPIHDPTLRELPYSKQIVHPLRIETQTAAERVEERRKGIRPDYIFLDTRETIETKMGSIDGFIPIRAPDLWVAMKEGTLDLKNKKVIVLCHNGNRSFEVAEELAARGIQANFIAGGFEKWVVEGHPISGLSERNSETLRAVLSYPNDTKLLETSDVTQLVQQNGAVFVDVRYEKEFELWHLPDAVNIPMRKMTTAELANHIGQLPRRPIILACYDRRGCFASRVLGYELHRAGYDFRGRYTVPWEYFEPVALGQALPHVALWQAKAAESIWGHAEVAVSGALYGLAAWSNTMLLGIFLLALLSRLLVLPFTLRAERDQLVTVQIKPEIDALKAKLAHDPTRLLRALRAINRRHGINPLRGLLTLLFLPLFFVSIAAIEMTADATAEKLLWIPNLGEPDPFFILPSAFSALILLYIERSTGLAGHKRLLAWCLGGPLLTLAMADLGAAAGLYAVISAVLVLLQREAMVLSRVLPRYLASRMARTRGLVPLHLAHTVPLTGIKASRLGQLIENGFPVPPGVVVVGGKSNE